MVMGIGDGANVGQLTATRAPAQNEPTNKAQAGFDMLTKTAAKFEQTEEQRISLAEFTGKGQNIDIMA